MAASGQPSTPTRVTSSDQTPTSTFVSLASSTTSPNRAGVRGPSFFASTASTGASLSLTRTLQQPLSVRADPALLTCFDPADKELYDLWAPKR